LPKTVFFVVVCIPEKLFKGFKARDDRESMDGWMDGWMYKEHFYMQL
jgi:hypothetical protein